MALSVINDVRDVIISHRHKFIFIKTRKTAGTSLQYALASICGDEDIVTPTGIASPDYKPRNYQGFFNPVPYLLGAYDMHRKSHCIRRLALRQRIHDHMFLRELLDLKESEAWRGYVRFCVERNPWDKVVSRYHWKYRQRSDQPDFENFVATDRLVSDFEMYSLDGNLAADVVLKYEELPDALNIIEKRIGVRIPSLSGANSWTRKDREFRAIYTPASRAMVASKFAREIAAFGYSFE